MKRLVTTYLLACGGTGGHLTPGIAVAQELMRRGYEVILAISEKKIDKALLEAYPQMRFIVIPSKPFYWKPFSLMKAFYAFLKGFCLSFSFIRRYRPTIIVGFGGFGMVPFVLAAKVLRQRVVLHEANRVPGRATRLLSPWVDQVCVPDEVELPGFNVQHVGLPLRDELVVCDKLVAREALNLPRTGQILLVFGGSQGARPLNNWAYQHIDLLAEKGIHLVCITGPGEPAKNLRRYTQDQQPVEMRFMPFCHKMAQLLSAVDCVVARSGAGTLAEIMHMRVPAIVVPFPQASDNHQLVNALYYAGKEAVKIVEQNSLETLWGVMSELLENHQIRQSMKINLAQLELISAQKKFVDILTLINE